MQTIRYTHDITYVLLCIVKYSVVYLQNPHQGGVHDHIGAITCTAGLPVKTTCTYQHSSEQQLTCCIMMARINIISWKELQKQERGCLGREPPVNTPQTTSEQDVIRSGGWGMAGTYIII